MLARKQGMIVTMSSVLGWRPLWHDHGVYAASKAFNSFLSECLRYSYQTEGVQFQVQLLHPQPIAISASCRRWSPQR